MKRRRLAALGAAVLLLGCPAPSDETDPPTLPVDRVEAILSRAGDAAQGSAVYADNCLACHPANGSAGTGAALAIAVPRLDDPQLVEVILDGATSMPTFDHLADQRIADLLAHLRASYP